MWFLSKHKNQRPSAQRTRRGTVRPWLEELEARLNPGTWSPAASMPMAGGGHTATLLGDGQVLFAGAASLTAAAELYNPANNTWSAADSMAIGRDGHTATLLANGKVLVTGGMIDSNADLTASAELYDPSSNTWSSAGSMATARFRHTATLLPNGEVLVAGGYDAGTFGSSLTVLSSAELYHPDSNTWSAAGSMATARVNHNATLLSNGQVLVVGGSPNNSASGLSSAELYDPASNTWSSAGSMATARQTFAETLLSNGKVLVVEGFNATTTALSSAELYDPSSNTWSTAGSLATARTASLWTPSAPMLNTGQVLVTGEMDVNGAALASSEVYDPVSNTWSAAGSMATARYNCTVTLLSNGQVLAEGGRGASGALSSAELYTPAGPADPSQSTISAAPASIQVGATATITLTARDANGVQEESGDLPVTFALGAGTGSGTFSAVTDNHNGTYTATFTGTAAGTISITGTINGQAITSSLPAITVTPVLPASQFVITSPTSMTAGGTVTFTVTAEDSGGHTASGYTGTVRFATSDHQAVLPANYTFTSADAGVHTFSATLKTAGLESLSAVDNVTSSITGQANIQVIPAAATHFLLSGPTSVSANTAFSITVTALDAYGNVAVGYAGTVHFKDSANGATLPANYTFKTSDNGVHTFSGLKLKTKGWQTITLVDTLTSSILGILQINVT